LDFLKALLARGLSALGTVGGNELAGLPGFELAPGFDFFDVGAVGDLAVGELVAQLLAGVERWLVSWLMPKCFLRYLKSFSWIQRLKMRRAMA
jgi:hypothetical protein